MNEWKRVVLVARWVSSNRSSSLSRSAGHLVIRRVGLLFSRLVRSVVVVVSVGALVENLSLHKRGRNDEIFEKHRMYYLRQKKRITK